MKDTHVIVCGSGPIALSAVSDDVLTAVEDTLPAITRATDEEKNWLVMRVQIEREVRKQGGWGG